MSWLVSEMENIGQKKEPCEGKNMFVPKMALENAFKNMEVTYLQGVSKKDLKDF